MVHRDTSLNSFKIKKANFNNFVTNTNVALCLFSTYSYGVYCDGK